MTVIKWDPFRDLNTMQDRMNRMFEDATRGGSPDDPASTTSWSPSVDIFETDAAITVKAEVPGVRQDDNDLSLENNVLTLKGERRFEKDTKDENYHRIERAYGTFSRSFSIPAVVDSGSIAADYKEGVLTITLPKSEKARPKQIAISG